MEVIMRRARRSDAAAINVIFNQAIEDGNSNLDIDSKDLVYRQQWLANHDKRHPVFVGELDGEVACWVALSPYSGRYPYDCVADLSIYVRRDLRGMGLGSLLLKFIEQQAAELGYYKIVLSVFGGNQAALHAYRRAGYRDVGVFRNHGYYKGKLVDIIFMERLLVPDMEFLKRYYSEQYPFYEEFFAEQQAEEEANLRRNGMLPPLEGMEIEEEFEEVPVENASELPEGIIRFLRSKKKPDYRKIVEAQRRQEAAEQENRGPADSGESHAGPAGEQPEEAAPVQEEAQEGTPEPEELPGPAGEAVPSPEEARETAPRPEGPPDPEERHKTAPEPEEDLAAGSKRADGPAETPAAEEPAADAPAEERPAPKAKKAKSAPGAKPRRKKTGQEDEPLEGQLNLEDVISGQ